MGPETSHIGADASATTKSIYALRTRYYNNSSIRIFEKEETDKLWEAINAESFNGGRGRGESFTVERYEVPIESSPTIDSHRSNTGKRRPHGGEYYADNDSIIFDNDEGYSPEPEAATKIWYSTITYIWAERAKDGSLSYIAAAYEEQPEAERGGTVIAAWQDNIGEIYETEEEAYECCNPQQVYDLP